MNPRIADWRGKRAWIVGASSGIGRATASALHAQGAVVTVSARGADALQAFTAQHAGAIAVPCDVTDAASVKAAADAVLAAGTPDLVLYCAGHYRAMRATEFDLAELQRHLDVNYVGALRLLDAVLPALRARRAGHVSLVGSVAGYRALPRSLAYGPTKAAMIQLAETLYMDLHDEGLGISIVNPGFVETPMTAQNRFRMPALISPEEAARAMLRGWARGRFEIHYPLRFTLMLKALALLPPWLYVPLVRKGTGL